MVSVVQYEFTLEKVNQKLVKLNEIASSQERAHQNYSASAVNSVISGHPQGLKKCPLVELSTHENYSHKRTPEKNQVDVCLQER